MNRLEIEQVLEVAMISHSLLQLALIVGINGGIGPGDLLIGNETKIDRAIYLLKSKLDAPPKLTVTLQDTECDRYKRMFHAACIDLGLINEALNLDPEQGGATPILFEINRLHGEAKVLRDLLFLALGVVETVTGDDAMECESLMELQNKIVAALKGSS